MNAGAFFNFSAVCAGLFAAYFIYEILRKPLYGTQRLTRTVIFILMESVFGLWMAAAKFHTVEEYMKMFLCFLLSVTFSIAVLILAVTDLRKVTSAYISGAKEISDNLRGKGKRQ